MKFAALIVVALLVVASFPATADAGNRCRGGCFVFAPVVAPLAAPIRPIVLQPVVTQPQPIAVVPVAPVRRFYATPVRDLLFGRYQFVPVAPCPNGNCYKAPTQPLPEDEASVQPVKE